MPTRRYFLTATAATTTATTLTRLATGSDRAGRAAEPLVGGALPMNAPAPQGHYRPPYRVGLGGVAIGTGFAPISSQQSDEVMRAAWAAGVRYFETSPWYGLGLSERRVGHFLSDQPREEYVISTKVGRILTPTDDVPETMWKAPSPFDYEYDYTADGARRSIEASLQRLGLANLDIVFIHDLAPHHFGKEWKGPHAELRMLDHGAEIKR